MINKGCFAPNIALQYVFIVLVFTFNTFLIWRTSPIYLNPFYWCHNIIFQIGSAPLRTPGVKTLFRCVTSQYLITPAKNSIILKLVAAKTLLFHGFIPQTLRILQEVFPSFLKTLHNLSFFIGSHFMSHFIIILLSEK